MPNRTLKSVLKLCCFLKKRRMRYTKAFIKNQHPQGLEERLYQVLDYSKKIKCKTILLLLSLEEARTWLYSLYISSIFLCGWPDTC
ncbi:unnamed protein product [Moneuplotes crassus]|uniref:Uncharacterized protein n=1 Tax=Euplotes crassus TaxID=5936 RepID=A0AAD1Y6Z6_EUPCR|nr:unnamed protein product [Moneuplotes crassus]